MNLEFSKHCLLCLDAIAVLQDNEKRGEKYSQNEFTIQNFQQLCEYLKVDFPVNSLKFKNVARILGTSSKNWFESLLCSKCMEMANGLSVLYGDLRRIQRRIDFGIRAIQEVVRKSGDGDEEDVCKQEINEDSAATAEENGHEISNQRPQKRRKLDKIKGGASSSVATDYLEFVETFRNLVEEVVTEKPEPAVLSAEAEALSRIYQELEDDIEIKNELVTKESFSSGAIKEESISSYDSATRSSYGFINEDSRGNDQEEVNAVFSDVANDVDVMDASENFDGSIEVEMEEEDQEMTVVPRHYNVSSSNYISLRNRTVKLPQQSPEVNSSQKSRPVFRCRFCNGMFDGSVAYYNHRKNVHPAESEALVIPSFYGPSPNTTTDNGNRSTSSVLVRVCPICGEHKGQKKNAFLEFMEHMLSHEVIVHPVTTVSGDICPPDEEKPYACDYSSCGQRFLHEMNLDLHKICYHESTLIQLKCEECGDTSSKNWEDLVSHLTGEHKSRTLYCCKSCPMAFMSADKALEHMEIHKMSKRLPCPECPSVSPSLKTLYEHFNEAHPKLLTRLQCAVCQEVFLMPSTYKNHVSKAHTVDTMMTTPASSSLSSTSISVVPSTAGVGSQRIKCPHCMEVKYFKNNSTLENHIRIHHDLTVEKHKCDLCQKAFVHRSTLRYHIQQVHLGIRYSCPHCPKTFTAKSLVKGHLKLHTGEGPPVINCETCGKVFTSLTALKAHVATQHEPSKPVPCEICGKMFSNLYSLRGHKSECHNLKQFACPHCPLTFAWLRKYEQHLKTHNRKGKPVEGEGSLKIVTIGSVNSVIGT